LAAPFNETVTMEMLLQHKGGFLKTGGGAHITTRLPNGPERGAQAYTEQPRFYSNTSMGIFHFIYALWAFASTHFLNPKSVQDVEIEYRDSNIDTYNAEIQKATSAAFNFGLYEQVFKPLEISATCDPQISQFPPSDSINTAIQGVDPIEHFPFYDAAKSYSSPSDSSGELLDPNMLNCATGGLYMSAKDLAKLHSHSVTPISFPRYTRTA